MQIAVLSDLHLGEKDKLDQFHRNVGAEEKLFTLLNHLEKSVDKIILLGDIFETLRGRGYSRERRLVKILKTYPEFSARILENDKYELLQGNHDLVTGPLLGAKNMLKIDEDGAKIVFFHGHQLDPIVGDFWIRNFERFGVWLGGWFERMGFDITKKGNFLSKMKSLRDEWGVENFEKISAITANHMNCDIVVTGHSHHPMKKELMSALYLNSGTRVAGRQDLVILDTASKQYNVYKQYRSSSQNY